MNKFAIPESVAQCPECGGSLQLEVVEWETDTGQPTQGGCQVGCTSDEATYHNGWMSDWAHIDFSVWQWAQKNVDMRQHESEYSP